MSVQHGQLVLVYMHRGSGEIRGGYVERAGDSEKRRLMTFYTANAALEVSRRLESNTTDGDGRWRILALWDTEGQPARTSYEPLKRVFSG